MSVRAGTDLSSDEKAPPEKPNVEIQLLSPDASSTSLSYDQTHRRLKGRHIQLISVGGTIGTALFVAIGGALAKGGPASLFLGFTLWSSFILAVNNCLMEMVTWIPISSPFVRFADRFVDPALGFAAGVNFFIFEAAMIPFEMTAFNLVLKFWTDVIPVGGVIAIVLVCYSLLNIFAVRWYGESEFWLSSGKVILATGLLFYTFITMVGGNPKHDAFGFRHFNPDRVEGAPFAEHIQTGDLGRFMGFLACFIQASFTIAGPDYVAMTAGEAEHPRSMLPRAFKSTFIRLAIFFIFGSLSVGIVVAYNDTDLMAAIKEARPGAGASPYVISMQNLGIPILPHIVNFLIMTAIFSAGNSYVYCASRTLFGLALEGKMPRFLTKCTKIGVPIYCVAITLTISLLAFLQVSNSSAVVLQWFINLMTASQLINYAIISFTYIRFYNALKAQGIDRSTLPHRSMWQPFCGYYALCGTVVMTLVSGYEVFLKDQWDVTSFLFSYLMVGLVPVFFVGWKLIKKTQWRPLTSVTFFEAERIIVDQYEANTIIEEPSNPVARAISKFVF